MKPKKEIDIILVKKCLCEEHLGMYETCRILNVTYTTLRKFVDKNHITIPPKYDENTIVALYEKHKKTTRDIGKTYNISPGTVNRILRRNGIDVSRKRNKTSFSKGNVAWNKKDIPEEEYPRLKELYEECVPVKQIAEAFNVSSRSVARAVKKLNLLRPKSMMARAQYDDSKDGQILSLYEEGKSSTEIGNLLGMSHCAVLIHLKHMGKKSRTLSESHYTKNNKIKPKDFDSYEKMYDLYVVNRFSKKDIGKMYGVDGSAVGRYLKKLGIKVRGCSEARKGLYCNEKHPNWKGGRTPLYMRIREYFACNQIPIVLKRDGYKCKLCGSKKTLHVHHIKSFKLIFDEILSEHPDLDVQKDCNELYDIMTRDDRLNDNDNLITYCRDCHLYVIHGYKRSEE